MNGRTATHQAWWAAESRNDQHVTLRHRTFDQVVVSRLVNAGGHRIASVLGHPARLAETLPGGGRLDVGSLVASSRRSGRTWTGRGRIRDVGSRFARPFAVDVELASLSAEFAEIRVSPASRRLPQWGNRRRSRYFDLAHRAADHLRTIVQEPDPAPVPAPEPTPVTAVERPAAARDVVAAR